MATHNALLGVKYGSTWLPCVSAGVNENTQIFKEDSGVVARSVAYVAPRTAAPTITLRSKAVATLWNTFSSLVGSTTGGALELYYSTAAAGGYAADNACVKKTLAANYGVWVWKSISADETGEATAEVDIYALYSGTTYPLTIMTGVAVPSAGSGLALDEMFCVGTAKDNTSFLDITRQRIDFGIEAEIIYCNGQMVPDTVAIRRIESRIDIGVTNLDYINTRFLAATPTPSPVLGIGTDNAFKLWFRKIDPLIGRVADATAEHFMINFMRGGYIRCTSQPSEWARTTPIGLEITAKADGTSTGLTPDWMPVEVDSTAAIA